MKKVVKMRLEKKGRGGKGVTVLFDVTGVPDFTEFSKELKKKMGTGGTIKNDTIEIQGDLRIRIREFLEKQDFLIKG